MQLEYVTPLTVIVGDEASYFDDLELRVDFNFHRAKADTWNEPGNGPTVEITALSLYSHNAKTNVDLPQWLETRIIHDDLEDRLADYAERETSVDAYTGFLARSA